MDISYWIKSSELKELYERNGFRISRTTNFGFNVVMEKDGYFVEIPSGAFDDTHDIKQCLLSLSMATGISIVDLFLSHDNVLKRIFEIAFVTGCNQKSLILATSKAVASIY